MLVFSRNTMIRQQQGQLLCLHSICSANHRCSWQVEFVVAFIGTTLARAVAAPLNSNYKKVRVAWHQRRLLRAFASRQQHGRQILARLATCAVSSTSAGPNADTGVSCQGRNLSQSPLSASLENIAAGAQLLPIPNIETCFPTHKT